VTPHFGLYCEKMQSELESPTEDVVQGGRAFDEELEVK
jgi:hypothetical protein